MKIGILGSGKIGATLGNLLAIAGHEVMISSRTTTKARELALTLGHGVSGGSFADATAFGELVILAIHWQNAVLEHALPDPALFTGKIVVDTMNPYRLDGSGFHELHGHPSSQLVANLLPGARIVKAFNTIYWKHLQESGNTATDIPHRRAIFIAGDDTDAKQVVETLILQIGFAPVDTGNLANSAIQEPQAPIYNMPMTAAEASHRMKILHKI